MKVTERVASPRWETADAKKQVTEVEVRECIVPNMLARAR